MRDKLRGKKSIGYIALSLVMATLAANLIIGAKNAKASTGFSYGTSPTITPTGGDGEASGNEVPKPYFVYMRVKEGVTDDAFTVAGEQVSGCGRTGGFYFSFGRKSNSTEVNQSQGTVPISTYVAIKYTYASHNGNHGLYGENYTNELNGQYTKVSTSAYPTDKLEPVYLVFDYNKNYSNGGAIYSEGGVYKKNICSIYSPRTNINEPFYIALFVK